MAKRQLEAGKNKGKPNKKIKLAEKIKEILLLSSDSETDDFGPSVDIYSPIIWSKIITEMIDLVEIPPIYLSYFGKVYYNEEEGLVVLKKETRTKNGMYFRKFWKVSEIAKTTVGNPWTNLYASIYIANFIIKPLYCASQGMKSTVEQLNLLPITIFRKTAFIPNIYLRKYKKTKQKEAEESFCITGFDSNGLLSYEGETCSEGNAFISNVMEVWKDTYTPSCFKLYNGGIKYILKTDIFVQGIGKKSSFLENLSMMKKFIEFHERCVKSWKDSSIIGKTFNDGEQEGEVKLELSRYIPAMDYSDPSEMCKEKWRSCYNRTKFENPFYNGKSGAFTPAYLYVGTNKISPNGTLPVFSFKYKNGNDKLPKLDAKRIKLDCNPTCLFVKFLEAYYNTWELKLANNNIRNDACDTIFGNIAEKAKQKKTKVTVDQPPQRTPKANQVAELLAAFPESEEIYLPYYEETL